MQFVLCHAVVAADFQGSSIELEGPVYFYIHGEAALITASSYSAHTVLYATHNNVYVVNVAGLVYMIMYINQAFWIWLRWHITWASALK